MVIPNTNNPPEFDSDTYYPDPVLAPKLADYLVINLGGSASDPDYPYTAVGEIEFIEVSEKRVDTGQGEHPTIYSPIAFGERITFWL